MSELFSQLGIEWHIIVAQFVNFAILFFVLNYFLYKPILSVLKKRREGIIEEKNKTEQLEDKLKNAEVLKEKVLADARAEGEKIIRRAEITAKELNVRLIQEAKEESAKEEKNTRKKLEAEKQKLFEEVKRDIGGLVAEAVEKTVMDAFDKKTSERLVEEALEIINADRKEE
ncbi:MAG: hypothetical protein A2836_00060 [Candidatus Taylorbacteria bacterium RIFCSPHIGHO2_01_FULL_45_63]|uniref:ATP synthase subunit b n=1 Tax=Candidatus Taylorbacteria bacterium RIFCSPHIGHO2_02_FULL_45_35 TaxID=1802311 RepID=A0A1G2MTL3_9BACT|nr:MAG: hypothetical protein A2836_00060 [Candidatus Taylorbacteria bacterium RIFCSPHIGHO2_01_FULL_45_63]OHA27207.1 MAG: hypothetical protein A3D56_01995 [Candidatus Taylorbacteria bacterium RIFCSPHIGHO2_02_FULL_45_35]OHA33701.1 MAG: hypothetical protein A3A22_03930 [Candidatus Taylorbacteria bacterium RIFCSPLOWO2_01_FULL_45_34b]